MHSKKTFVFVRKYHGILISTIIRKLYEINMEYTDSALPTERIAENDTTI